MELGKKFEETYLDPNDVKFNYGVRELIKGDIVTVVFEGKPLVKKVDEVTYIPETNTWSICFKDVEVTHAFTS